MLVDFWEIIFRNRKCTIFINREGFDLNYSDASIIGIV